MKAQGTPPTYARVGTHLLLVVMQGPALHHSDLKKVFHLVADAQVGRSWSETHKVRHQPIYHGTILLYISDLLYAVIDWILKNKKNSGAIFALNFLLGWTVIGWIGAFIWSLTNS
jgi:hypothetical protein